MGINLAQLLLRSARAFPQQTALARGALATATYAELAARVARLAGGLSANFGLQRDERVALFMKNCPQYVELLFACWHAGLTAVPINAKLHPRELEFILQDCGARACFVSADLAGAVASIAAGAPALERVIDVEGGDYAALFGGPAPAAERAAEDTAWLFYTSGTTGRPKGVMLTHRNLMAMTLNYFSDVDAIAPGDSILHAAPMSHGSGLYILPHVAHAAVNVVPESGGFEPAEIYALMRHFDGVTMFAAPTMVKRLVDCPTDADTANLKTLVYGGGPMYVAECRRAMQRFGYKLAQIYGQGESPMTITAMGKSLHADTLHPRYEQRLASVGLPQTGIEVRIAASGDRESDANGEREWAANGERASTDVSELPLPAGEIGEVLVRGDSVMRGYWNDPAVSAEALRGGWLHTGDIGALDEEGFLTLKDRSKDVIISGGANIYPREVEEVLLRHPLIAEVSVVGQRDPEWGESVLAFVVARAGARIDTAELDRLCLDHIARFKRPRAYRFLDALPRNNTGKVLKGELRRRLQPGGESG
ncbi:MAG: AMP-binding protein [Burkholderiales bacterium]